MKVLVGVVLLLVVSGCGGAETTAGQGTPSVGPVTVTESLPTKTLPAPSSTVASSAPATKATAAGLAAKVKAGAPSIKKIVQITEDNDPNNLIGRPTGYLDAAVLYESTLTCDKPGADCGATIEIWPTAKAATDRAAYIQKNLKDIPMLGTEYNYTNDSALLRVNGELKPSLAAKLNALFGGTPYTP
ncbi:hypothetical protein [Streptomyces sp. SID13031]|uniref:hypothetical protein n=1 Tax=Streptomyces sp. SID13031 TaxID=2706046 RepID=UPI0013C856EE|nr:hypothetical protein [Streptomyces sp. SID13031]NEA35294.1 hypothetical protein [Streptomyces sp. SID13031]